MDAESPWRRRAEPSRPDLFLLHVADWFTGGSPGRFLVHSDNVGVRQAPLARILRDAGHSLTVSTRIPLTRERLARFDGVFIGGYPADQSVLVDYVRRGGNVYLFVGCGTTGHFVEAPAEAAAWKVATRRAGSSSPTGRCGAEGG